MGAFSSAYEWYQDHKYDMRNSWELNKNGLICGAVLVFSVAAALYYTGDKLNLGKRQHHNNIVNIQEIEGDIRQGNYDNAKWLIKIVRSSTTGKDDPTNRVTNSWANELSDIVDKH